MKWKLSLRPPIAWIRPSASTQPIWSIRSGNGARLSQRSASGIVDLVDVDRIGIAAADGVDLAGERDRRDRAARAGQRPDALPGVGAGIPDEALRMRRPVLLVEAADRIDFVADRRHADMVGRVRQRRRFAPAVDGGVVDMVIVAVDLLLAIAADHVHPPPAHRRPGHLAARNRQRRARHPAAGPRRCAARRNGCSAGLHGLRAAYCGWIVRDWRSSRHGPDAGRGRRRPRWRRGR